MKRVSALLLVAPLALILAACGSSGSGSDAEAPASSPAATSSATPTAPSTAPGSPTASPTGPPFNPCDGLDVGAISKALGAPLKKTTGTVADPRCALLPRKKGDPTFNLSYLWFDGGLDAAWDSIPDDQKPTGTITEPRVAGADAAKLIVQRRSNGYVVSAFLQNGDLVQSLNGVALPPYDAKAMARATDTILAELSAAAPER